MTAKPQPMAGQSDASDDLIAELAKLMAQDAQGGWPARAGFTLLSLLWLAATAQGIRLAIRGELARHRRWMACSMALTSAAVTLRLMLAAGGLLQLAAQPGDLRLAAAHAAGEWAQRGAGAASGWRRR